MYGIEIEIENNDFKSEKFEIKNAKNLINP